MKRVVGAVLLALALAGAAGCGGDDNGGVIEGPSTTVSNGPTTTRGFDYS